MKQQIKSKIRDNMAKTIVIVFAVLWFDSCKKAFETEFAEADPICNTSNAVMVLGKKLNNPYSLENMRRAYEALRPQTRADNDAETFVTSTHRYVKFLPHNEEELSLLKRDTSLVLYQYPLDYEIISYGGYHDPSVPEDEPTPLYCSVPINKPLPESIESVVLAELFIPEELPKELTRSDSGIDEYFLDALVAKAFELTGNEYEQEGSTRGSKSEWIPQGSVKYYDNVLGKECPIEGLQVRCHRWFTTYKAYTDSQGRFRCKNYETFKNPATYSIYYERYDFEIRDFLLSTATYDGPQISGAWDIDFARDDRHTYYSTIFRAAFKYYYQGIHGLSRPPLNSFWKTQLKILASMENRDDYDGYHSPALRFLGLGSQIHIYSNRRNLDQTFATTIHELAHAAHWGLYRSDYNHASEFVVESWSRGVELFLTQDVYPKYYIYAYSTVAYTGIIRDLMDGAGLTKRAYYYYEKDQFHPYTIPKSYTDYVRGYTMPQIESSLEGARTADDWKTNLKTMYKNETESQLDDAFTFWSIK